MLARDRATPVTRPSLTRSRLPPRPIARAKRSPEASRSPPIARSDATVDSRTFAGSGSIPSGRREAIARLTPARTRSRSTRRRRLGAPRIGCQVSSRRRTVRLPNGAVAKRGLRWPTPRRDERPCRRPHRHGTPREEVEPTDADESSQSKDVHRTGCTPATLDLRHKTMSPSGPGASRARSARGARAGRCFDTRRSVLRSVRLGRGIPPGWVCQSPRYVWRCPDAAYRRASAACCHSWSGWKLRSPCEAFGPGPMTPVTMTTSPPDQYPSSNPPVSFSATRAASSRSARSAATWMYAVGPCRLIGGWRSRRAVRACSRATAAGSAAPGHRATRP